jgi:hypothetical protein
MTQVLVVALLLTPWIVRNWFVLGSPIWSRSNTGLELHLSNNDRTSPNWDDNRYSGVFRDMHPVESAQQRNLVIQLGEVAYNRQLLIEAKLWITTHPSRFLQLCLERSWLFWFPIMKRPIQTAGLAFITLLGIAGLVSFFRKGDPASWYFAAVWLAFPPPFYLFQQSGRMRYPIEWSMYLFAGYLIWQLTVHFRHRMGH